MLLLLHRSRVWYSIATQEGRCEIPCPHECDRRELFTHCCLSPACPNYCKLEVDTIGAPLGSCLEQTTGTKAIRSLPETSMGNKTNLSQDGLRRTEVMISGELDEIWRRCQVRLVGCLGEPCGREAKSQRDPNQSA